MELAELVLKTINRIKRKGIGMIKVVYKSTYVVHNDPLTDYILHPDVGK